MVGLAGAAVSVAAVLAALAAVPPAGPGGTLPPELLGEVFDVVTDASEIAPGQSAEFSYPGRDGSPVLWGMQAEGAAPGLAVRVSDAGGAAVAERPGPVVFDVFVPRSPGDVAFVATNSGDAPATVRMMFGGDPAGRGVLSDGGLPPALAAAAASAAALVAGACAMVAGAALTVADRARARRGA